MRSRLPIPQLAHFRKTLIYHTMYTEPSVKMSLVGRPVFVLEYNWVKKKRGSLLGGLEMKQELR